MLDNQKPYTLDRVVRLGITAALIWGLIWILGYLSDVLIPFIAAFLLAYLINPLVVRIQKRVGGRHGLAVFLALLAVVAAALVIVGVVAPLVASEIGQMGRVLSALVNNSEVAERAAQSLPPDIWQSLKDLAAQEEVQQFFRTDSFMKIVQAAARKLLPGVWGLITGTTTFILGLFGLTVVGLYLVFLLLDYRKVQERWTELLPPAWREPVTEFVADFDRGMNRYFRAQAAVASLVGVLSAIGFALIGLPLGVLLGLLVGLLNMVPYLQIAAIPPALLLAVAHALETGGSIWVALGLVALVFAVVQVVQDGVLVPRIMGDATGLSPAFILLSLSVWGKLLGVFGLLIALPMTALLIAYYRRFLVTASASREDDRAETGG